MNPKYKHTPGDWNEVPVYTGLGSSVVPDIEAMANARLIAHAPEMLAELLQCEKDFKLLEAIAARHGYPNPIGSLAPHMRVRALIDKAATPA